MLSHKFWQNILSILLLAGLILSLFQPGKVRAMPPPTPDEPAVVFAPAGLSNGQTPPGSRPVVRSSTKNDTSPALRDIEPIPPRQPSRPDEVREVPMFPLPKREGISNGPQPPDRDPVLQSGPVRANMPVPGQNFAGISNVNGVLPPDTDGDVGPNHYVQMVNLAFAIWDKSGSLLYGPADSNTIWAGFGGICETNNDGDPIVLYDQLADRWMMSQFALNFPNNFHQCIAISQTGDPTGAWHRYDFLYSTTEMNDYPKFGVWPDGYYMSVNQFTGGGPFNGIGAVAFERDQMLSGQPAQMVAFYDPDPSLGGMLPSDLDGTILPPSSTPNYFVQVDDGSPDKLQIWEFDVDWTTPANSTFTKLGNLPTAPFDSNMCGGARNCIPQPNTGQGLDAIADRLMFRLQYRNFGSYQTMVTNHTVDVDGTDHAGIRWYELRDSGGGWFINQQGTYAGDTPDAENRWMGSVAMDGNGNMALGYSVSSNSVYPSIRYVGRLSSDPAGVMPQGETTLIAGGGSQTHSAARWGDYSAMTVDPVDDCTFWYTQEYYQTTSSTGWQTRIGAFKFPSCTSVPEGSLQGTVTDASTTNPITNAQVMANVYSTYTDGVGLYSMTVPTGTYAMTATHYGYLPGTAADVPVLSGTVTTQNFTLTPAPTFVVSGTVTDVNTGWPLSAGIDIGGYPGGTIWTDPASGFYSVTLVAGTSYNFSVAATNYLPQSRAVGPLTGNETQDFALEPDFDQGCPTSYDSFVFSDGFESGSLSPEWSITTTFEGRVQVTTTYPYSGSYSVLLDDSVDGGSTSIAAVILTQDLTGQGNVKLNFWWREFGDENDPEDGVFISDDYGANWYEALSFNNGPATFRNDVVDISAAATANGLTLNDHFWIKFQFYDNYSIPTDGYAIDEVKLNACTPFTSGRVIGYVYDANTGLPLAGAGIGSDGGRNTTTNLAGFYQLFDTPGMHTLTATMSGGYGPDVQTVTIVQNNTVQQNFNLPAGQLSYTPPNLSVTLPMGTNTTVPFTLTNNGDLAAMFEFKELDKGMTILGPFELPDYVVKPFKQGRPSAPGDSPPPPIAPPYAAGDEIQSWSSGLAAAWGIGYDAGNSTVWVSSPAPSWGGNLTMYEYTLAGTLTGRSHGYTWSPPNGPADAAYNHNTGTVWVMNVDTATSNCIYEIDPAIGFTGNTICPGGGTGFAVSQRGLAYDPTTDTYFAGSWNDSMIHHFAADGTMLDEVNVSLTISGLAYNPDTQHLFAQINGGTSDVYVLDVANSYALLGQFHIGTLVGGAGLEMDCDGNLWAVDHSNETIIQAESGETTSMCNFDVTWLSEDPISGTVASLVNQPVNITFDAGVPEVTQPGHYYAQLKIQHNTPYNVANVPMTMTVTTPPTYGKLTGTVTGLEQCDNPGAPLKDAAVFLESGTGLTRTLTTDISGTYAIWLDAINDPLTATVSHAGYVTQTLTGINVTAGVTTTADFDLRLDAPCVDVNPDTLSVTVSLGMSATLPLTLNNSGAKTATFRLREQDQGFTLLLPDKVLPYERRTITYWDPTESAPVGDSKTWSPYIWDTGSPIPTGPRYRAAGTSCDGQTYYIFGGWNDTGSVLNEAWMYDPAGDSWTSLAPMPVALTNLEAICIDNYIYLVGGYTGLAHTNNFQIYDTISDSWVNTTWPNVRTPMTAAWNGKLYAFGGNPGPSNETWVYDPTTSLWTGPLALMPTANAYGAAITAGDYIYQIGGGLANTAQRYDPASDTWDNSGPQLQDNRMSALTVWYGDYIYVVSGGGSGGAMWTGWDTTEVYNPSSWPGGAWVYDDETVPTPAVGMGGDCADDKIWGVGGTSGSTYDVNRALDDNLTCHFSSEVPWLSEDPITGTIAADTGTQWVDVTFDAGVPEVLGPGEYYATLSARTNEPANNNHTVPVTMTVLPVLSIDKTVQLTNNPAQRGDSITYTIVVANSSGVDMTGVRITDTLPLYVTGPPLDQIVSVPAGGSVLLTINATVDSDAPYDEIITNTAYYSHVSSSGQDSAVFSVEPASPSLSIDKMVELTNDPAQEGDPITYTIVMANSGLGDAINVRITDTLPLYVTGPPLDQIVNVSAGDSVTLTINAMVDSDAPYDEIITNTAYYSHISDSGQDSAAFAIISDTIPPTFPSNPLITPTGNITLTTDLPVFQWVPAYDKGGVVSYTLLISSNGSISLQEVSTTTVTIPTPVFTPTVGLAEGVYTWTVKAHDAAGNASGYCPAESFIIAPADSQNQIYLPVIMKKK